MLGSVCEKLPGSACEHLPGSACEELPGSACEKMPGSAWEKLPGSAWVEKVKSLSHKEARVRVLLCVHGCACAFVCAVFPPRHSAMARGPHLLFALSVVCACARACVCVRHLCSYCHRTVASHCRKYSAVAIAHAIIATTYCCYCCNC